MGPPPRKNVADFRIDLRLNGKLRGSSKKFCPSSRYFV